MKLNSKQLLNELNQFIGTSSYHRLSPCFVVTDGLKYLMDQANCYWLGHLFGLFLARTSHEENPFIVLILKCNSLKALLIIEDGNGNELDRQNIDCVAFPLKECLLFASWYKNCWVGMLPTEY
ncbi:DUF6876 family protein [Polynucleobacter sp. 80A-SIGWE]|uniref:DUF6876 family protein n=1 Tax=Polynucleobacter sp. 80A-SIGWE TaxID=2689100 RepID=UPI001C0D49CC|nr:DUF6876 family protein [Polynucleobacter sp. 80A-SIGWE]MBU3588512.1 hypothetical protein [Polynucleobacter sp. 80A-SIGWE]